VAAGPWAQLQECEFCFQNSKWKTYTPRNIPKKSYRYFQFCMQQMGKVFLNDDVWATYDVIIDTHSSRAGNYDSPGGSFEQWVRTAKTFVMDYYERLPCASQSGDAIEGAYTVLTAKPFEDYKNFAIGTLIQDTDGIIFPVEEAIKNAFEGRTRCPFSFYEQYNNLAETCPMLSTAGAPPNTQLLGIDAACTEGDPRNHLPAEWANEPYVAPYLLADRVPDRAIWRWDEYGPIACGAVCPFVPSFCELKGIVCDERRLAEEAQHVPVSNRRKLTAEDYQEMRDSFNRHLEEGGEI
jgi:hypothetical protein